MTCTTQTRSAQRQQKDCLVSQNNREIRKDMDDKKRITELENIVESQHQHIAMLQNDLYNEQLRNSNLSELALAIDKQKESKPEES